MVVFIILADDTSRFLVEAKRHDSTVFLAMIMKKTKCGAVGVIKTSTATVREGPEQP